MPRSRYDEDEPGYTRSDGIFRDAPHSREPDGGGSVDGGGEEGKALSVTELLYSSSSYYAIAKPGTPSFRDHYLMLSSTLFDLQPYNCDLHFQFP